MQELKKCPCGSVPKSLQINAQDRDKWAFVSGDCCGEWSIEYRNNYARVPSEESMERARVAWNNAPREALRQQTAPVDLEQFREACHWMKAHGSLQRCAEADRLLSIIDNSSQRPVVDDARMARALEWLRAIAECSEDPADKPHIEAIEEAISAYQQNNGDQKR